MLEDSTLNAYTLNLTDQQVKTLKDLLAPSTGWEDEPGENYELTRELERAEAIAKSITLLYVNEYELSKEYGGPEEGGWYYTASRLHRSAAFDNYVAAIDYAVKYLREVHFISKDEYRRICTDDYKDIIRQLSDPFWHEYGMQLWSNLDKYGEGTIVAIEPTPGLDDNSHIRQYYH